MKKLCLIAILGFICCNLLATNAQAKDGKRKGLILGAGLGSTTWFESYEFEVFEFAGNDLGAGWLSTDSGEAFQAENGTNPDALFGDLNSLRPSGLEQYSSVSHGVGTEFILGYGFDEHNLIVAELILTMMRSQRQGFHTTESYGVNWYHYFGSYAHSLFASIGAKTISFSRRDFSFNPNGYGLSLATGFELRPSLQVGAHALIGKTTGFARERNISQLNIVLTHILY